MQIYNTGIAIPFNNLYATIKNDGYWVVDQDMKRLAREMLGFHFVWNSNEKFESVRDLVFDETERSHYSQHSLPEWISFIDRNMGKGYGRRLILFDRVPEDPNFPPCITSIQVMFRDHVAFIFASMRSCNIEQKLLVDIDVLNCLASHIMAVNSDIERCMISLFISSAHIFLDFKDAVYPFLKSVGERSVCVRRKAAALVLSDDGDIFEACNVVGIECKEHCIRNECGAAAGTKLEMCYGQHAEQLAIMRAMNTKHYCDGATLYTIDYPCVSCAKVIIMSGIKKVCHWKKDDMPANFVTEQLFKENRVKVCLMK